jgi:hypothetical protein
MEKQPDKKDPPSWLPKNLYSDKAPRPKLMQKFLEKISVDLNGSFQKTKVEDQVDSSDVRSWYF